MRRLWSIFIVVTCLALAGCSSAPDTADGLPAGDAARGAALFMQSINGAPPCTQCHTVDGSTLIGPSLQGFASRGGSRLDGVAAREYAYRSITRPASYLVSGFGNLMYNQYAQRLSTQQIADLITYLLSL
jgi:mono/diheme cytochrome c family protein